MATFTWYLQGTSPTTIEATDSLQFAGGTFNSAINVSSYNSSTHVKSSGGADDSSANTPRNNKFISQTGGGGGDSQADWGGGTEDIDQILTSECAIKVNFAHGSSVAITNAKIYAYDGVTPATGPSDVDVRLAEQGDTNFTNAEGSGTALALNDKTTATSHDYYVIASVSPDTVGLKSFKFRMELTYS